jgi:hypothetical protein
LVLNISTSEFDQSLRSKALIFFGAFWPTQKAGNDQISDLFLSPYNQLLMECIFPEKLSFLPNIKGIFTFSGKQSTYFCD